MPNIIPVFISYAGCPHRCAFCNQRSINSQHEYSLSAVYEQINKYLAYFPIESDKEIAFYGGSFTGIAAEQQEELLSIAKKLNAKANVKKIRLSTRPDYIDKKVIERLQRYSVNLVELGVQSLDESVLKLANRGHDSNVVFKAASMLREAGLDFGIQLMTGMPGQDWQSIKATAEQVVELKPAVVRIYPLVIFADTDFALQYKNGQMQLADFTEIIEQTAYMANVFAQNGLNVIRIGLQEDDGLREQGAVLAGFHHPAFGELVASCNYREKIRQLLLGKQGKVNLLVPRKEISQALGHKKANVEYFAKEYPELRLNFIQSEGSVLSVQEETPDE